MLMAVKRIPIEEFLTLAKSHLLLDVRSPGEFLQAHIPGAHSLPLFSDEERKVVGTAYKQQSKQVAIKIGLKYFGVKMVEMVETVEDLFKDFITKSSSTPDSFSRLNLNQNPSTKSNSDHHQEPNTKSSSDQNQEHNKKSSSNQSLRHITKSSSDQNQEHNKKSSSDQNQGHNKKSNSESHRGAYFAPGTVLVHCWRGGMRSAGVAWLLDLYGYQVYTLQGGYKAYRGWVLEQFEKEYPIQILGGYTGSGKTEILKAMAQQSASIIDLEGLAGHKGSAFGNMGLPVQPSQEHFENKLAEALAYTSTTSDMANSTQKCIWMEDESQRIGTVIIPSVLYQKMREKKVFFIDIPFESRLDYICKHYGKFPKDQLVNAIIRIKKKLGGLETKTAINSLVEDDVRESFRVLLQYYDKSYSKGLERNRQNLTLLVNRIEATVVDDQANASLLMVQE